MTLRLHQSVRAVGRCCSRSRLLLCHGRTPARSSRPPMIFSTAARSSNFQQHSVRPGKGGKRLENISERREAEKTGGVAEKQQQQQQQQQSQQNQQQQNQRSNSSKKINSRTSSKRQNSQEQQKQDQQKKNEQQKQQEQQKSSAKKRTASKMTRTSRLPPGR